MKKQNLMIETAVSASLLRHCQSKVTQNKEYKFIEIVKV